MLEHNIFKKDCIIMNKAFIIKTLTVVLSQIISPLAYAGDSPNTKDLNAHSYLGQKIIQGINKNADTLGVKWVKGGIDSFSKYNFTAFSVLSETSNQVVFAQGRFGYNKGDNKGDVGKTLNLGLGARNLFEYSSGGDNFIFGINAFYDLKNAEKGLFSSPHKRFSLGLEFKDSMGDIYGNIYRRQSGFINDERVLNGYDFGFSAQIPSIPNSKFNINRYDFSSNHVKKSGTKLRAEYFLTPYISFGGEYDKSNQNNSSKKLFVNFTYNFGEKLSQQVNTAKANTTQIWDKRYDEVIRENKVYLEKKLVINLTPPINLAGDVGQSSVVVAALTDTNGYNSATMGAVVYSIIGDNLGATIDSNSGSVTLSGAAKDTTTDSEKIKIKAVITANDQYSESELIYDFAVRRVVNPYTALGDSMTTALSVGDGNHYTIPAENALKLGGSADASYNPVEMGAVTYSVSSISLSIAATTSIISGGDLADNPVGASSTTSGTITIDVSFAGGTKYQATTFTYDVTYN